jgi:immune inhibitor A
MSNESHSQPDFDRIECLVPPSPELERKIIATERRFRAGESLPSAPTEELLDFRTFTLIKSRPPKTRAHTLISTNKDFAPVTGTRRAIVLLVDFPDNPATQSLDHFRDMLFSLGTYPTGSMRDFYKEASYGKLDVTGEVHGWFRAPQPKTFYTNGDNGFGTYPQNAQRLVEDVLALADPSVGFAPFDNDGDGVIEACVIIAAGSGAEETGNPDDIWSHKWSISPRIVDSKRVTDYFMAPEDGRVGVMAHELGHLLLGQPDLYDTDYSSRGTGRWDLMAGGSWNNGGDTPAHPTAYVKSKVGWLNVTTVFNASQNITLEPYVTSDKVVKLPIGSMSSNEYFLLSNRQRSGFDAHLPGDGCIIEHIDENQSNNTDEDHYLVDIEQCDGRADLNKNANSGDSTDPFPTAAQNKFTASTTPNSKSYSGSDSQIEVTEIQRAGANITAKVSVGAAAGGPVWVLNKRVFQTFASADSQNAWANIESLGWRKIAPNSPDGVTNLHNLFCEAAANNGRVHAFADAAQVSIAYLV